MLLSVSNNLVSAHENGRCPCPLLLSSQPEHSPNHCSMLLDVKQDIVISEDNKLPRQKIKLDVTDQLKVVTKNISDMGHLTEKYGIQDDQAKPQKGATNTVKKKEIPTK